MDNKLSPEVRWQLENKLRAKEKIDCVVRAPQNQPHGEEKHDNNAKRTKKDVIQFVL